MKNKPVSLVSLPTPEPQQDVIGLLRDALARAERGEVRAVGVVMQIEDRGTATTYAMGDGSDACMVYSCEHLKHRLMFENVED